MNLSKLGAYVRQPTTLFAGGIILGTGVASWFGVLPDGAAVGLLAVCLPLLASDSSGQTVLAESTLLNRVAGERDDLLKVVHALSTHKDIGPAATQIIADTVPGGALLATAASVLTSQSSAAIKSS
ncbi:MULTISPECIES: hypothetical protein [Acetobacter]|uniref:hypothetical protein n=1 Tax=Acetobacter TaxID=434 RepID=UPI0007776937|nr:MULTISPECIES: hypothetical protein [Acetobacter]MCP1272017.1 hypothetical protein [Acetobacter cerevisiae]MCP1279975.1 hypothetical protein [Acetobacter cerevisiae]